LKGGEYAKMHGAEMRFWWFAAKGEMVRRLAGRWFPQEGDFLDTGCGTGANLERLRDIGRWTGLDSSSEALVFCAWRKGGNLARGEAARLPFGDGAFDGACILDVLEHMEDDRAAVSELFRVLHPGGRVIATVPAHPALWSAHDEAMGHVRRYSRDSLRALLEGAGFSVLFLRHFMGFLFPVMAPVKLLQRLWGDPEETVSYNWPAPVNGALVGLCRFEAALMESVNIPFGTTLVAVAERPAD